MPSKPKFSDAQIKAALVEFGTFTAAAKALDCSDRTIGLRVKSSAELQAAAEEGRERITTIAESNIVAEILDGNERASRWWLQSSPEGKRRGYGVRQEIAPAVAVDPENFIPHRPESWEELRQKYPDLGEPIVIEDSPTRAEPPPTEPTEPEAADLLREMAEVLREKD